VSSRTELAVYETFEDMFGRRSTLDELIADIRSFRQQSILWVCATVVTGLQLWGGVDSHPEVYARFLSLFFDADTRARLIAGYWSSPKRLLFHRRQILLIAKLAISHCSGNGLDARRSGGRFGFILLKASDQFHYGLLPATAAPHVARREDLAKIVTEMVAVGESGSQHIGNLITRSHLMLTRFTDELKGTPDFIDVAREHQSATGLTLEEFEALILGVHARFGENLVQKLNTEPGALPLKEANFASTAIPYDKVRRFLDSVSNSPAMIAGELEKGDNGPNDFTVFRKFPLVEQLYNPHLTTAWFGFLMLDNLFFLDKVQAGPYWNANDLYALKLRKFWGAVFEKYVNELLRQSCAGTTSIFLPDPRPPSAPSTQLCDGIVVSGDAIVLMEYKSSMFRADTKYGGRDAALAKEIENKLVYDREAKERKGVGQLAEAVKKILGKGAPLSLPGIDLGIVKRVYLYLITLDSIGGTIGISPFLDTFLQERLTHEEFAHLEIRPLFCSDVAALENISGCFAGRSLPAILEQWFTENPSLTAPLVMTHIPDSLWRGNEWLRQEWNSIFKRIVTILFPGKDPDAALKEAIELGLARRR
jgi:hypothetical protein